MSRRILFLVTDLEIGGAPLVVKDLACGMAQRGYEVAVACLGKDGPVAEEIRKCGIDATGLGAKGVWDVGVFWRLGKVIKRFRPDVLHCSLVHANVAGRIVGRLMRVPHVVASIHTAEQGKKWHLWAERLTWRLSDCTVCVSQSVRNHVRKCSGVPPERLRVIVNGIELKRFSDADAADLESEGLKRGRKTLIFTGRLDPVKNVGILLEAVGDLKGRCEVQLLIVGDGSERGKLEALAERLGMRERVSFCGFRRDVERYLKASDILVLPSFWEGLPVSAVEAMAAGLPVVGSLTAGIQDVVEDGRTGILVPVGDREKLAEAVENLIKNDKMVKMMGQTGKDKAIREFGREGMIESYINLFKSL